MPKPPSPDALTHAGKVADILEATRELVAAQGFHGTPMAQIAERAGVSVGTIYHHFAGKTELLNAVYLSLKQDVAASVLARVPQSAPTEERLQHLLEVVLAYHAEHPAETSFMEQYERSPYILEGTHRQARDLLAPVVELVDEARREGWVKELPTTTLVAMTLGAVAALAKLTPGATDAAEPNRAPACSAALDILRRDQER